jgi:hypothetical protein
VLRRTLVANHEGRVAAMCWKCENPNGTEEKYLDELRRMMRDHHGWQVQFVDHGRSRTPSDCTTAGCRNC